MKKKLLVGAIAFTLIAGTGTGVYAYNQNQKVLATEAAELEKFRAETIDNAEKAIDSLYNSTKTMLVADFDVKVKNAEKAIDKVEEENAKDKLSQELNEIKEIANIQQEVYSTLEDGVLATNVTKEKLENIGQKLIVIKSKNEAIFTHLTEYLTEADNQLLAINEALDKVKEAEKSLNRDTYNSALALVDDVKNDVKKDELKKQLKNINEKLVAIEENRKKEEAKKAAEKAEAEKIVIAEQEKQKQTTTSSIKQTPTANYESSSKSNTNSSTNSKKSSSNSNQSISGNSKNSNAKDNTSTSEKKPASNSSGSTGNSSSNNNDWDKIGEQLENHDWNKTGSGEIDEGGNTWESWE